MTIRLAARVAGIALIATQIAAVGPQVGSPSGGVALAIVVVAVNPPRGAARRWPLAAVASAVTALLIVVAVTCLLPALPGYVSNWAPPTYTDLARLVDPILEFAVYALLTVAVGAHVWLERIRRRRVTTRPAGIAPNEMVVLPPPSMDSHR